MPTLTRSSYKSLTAFSAVFIGAGFLFSLSASAQEQERARAGRELKAETRTQETAEAARARAQLSTGETVTFGQILADPDNLELNFRYAKAQVERGDLLGASATLERILLIDPTQDNVRLFHALVLYRLDSLADARQQVQILRASSNLPSDIRAQADDLWREIQLKQKSTRFSTSLSLGFGYDSNRNSAPSSKELLFSDVPLPLTGTSRHRPDTSLQMIYNLSAAHDLGMQAGHQLIGSFDTYVGEQTVVDDLDLHSFSFETGALLKTFLAQISPTGFFDHILLSRETYLRSSGVRARWLKPIGSRWTLESEQSWAHEDYSGINESTTAAERSGNMINFDISTGFLLTGSMRLSAGLHYEHKDAKANYYAYEGFGINGSHTWILPKGQFLLESIDYETNTYAEPDTSVSTRKRRDQQLRLRATYGAPVMLFVPDAWVPDWIGRDLTTSLSFEQFRSLSSITNYTYSNSKIVWMVTKRVEF